MKELDNSTDCQDYFEGYKAGLNPFLAFKKKRKKAFLTGFKSGRSDYESRNGLVSCGIPKRIVTEKTLEDFLIAGMYGFEVDAEGYTAFQMNVILKWYKSGVEKYDPIQYINLTALLDENEIEMSADH
jgi:hypothetical protein